MAEFNICEWEKVLYDDKGNVIVFAFVDGSSDKTVARLEHFVYRFTGRPRELPSDFDIDYVFIESHIKFWITMQATSKNFSAMTEQFSAYALDYLNSLKTPLVFENGDVSGTNWRMN
jgi:hypothetical protein